MKTTFNYLFASLLASFVLSVTSCKKDDGPVLPDEPQTAVSGVYILNEGDFDMDNASLSYFDVATEKVKNDFFLGANPTSKLGEAANDIGIYGSKLYITVTNSNKVEIVDAADGKILKTLTMDEPRYVAFYGKYAFISSYTNRVFVVDTTSMSVSKEIEVGRTPEQLAVSGDQVFVANAGWKDGYAGGEYDNRVSVIDAKNLVKIKDIEVAENVDRVYADDKGRIYANSTTIYGVWPEEIAPSRLHVIDVATGTVDTLAFGAGLMAITGQTAYLISDNYEQGKMRFLEMNTNTREIKPLDLLSGIDNLNGLAVDPDSGDIWVAAYAIGGPGTVYRYQSKTANFESYIVGSNPKTFAFKK